MLEEDAGHPLNATLARENTIQAFVKRLLPPTRRVRQEPTSVSMSTLNPEAPSYVLNPTTNALCSTKVKSVLLQTARALIYNPQAPGSRMELRILLDVGSQRSYMTERARRMLNIAPDGEQQLSVAAFGSARGTPKVCPIVNAGILLKRYPSITDSLCPSLLFR